MAEAVVDTRPVEQKAIDEIREVLKKHNCVVGIERRLFGNSPFGETITEVKVYHASYEHGPVAGIMLHSE